MIDLIIFNLKLINYKVLLNFLQFKFFQQNAIQKMYVIDFDICNIKFLTWNRVKNIQKFCYYTI